MFVNTSTREENASAMLDIIQSLGEEGFDGFVAALQQCSYYSLANSLQDKQKKYYSHQESSTWDKFGLSYFVSVNLWQTHPFENVIFNGNRPKGTITGFLSRYCSSSLSLSRLNDLVNC